MCLSPQLRYPDIPFLRLGDWVVWAWRGPSLVTLPWGGPGARAPGGPAWQSRGKVGIWTSSAPAKSNSSGLKIILSMLTSWRSKKSYNQDPKPKTWTNLFQRCLLNSPGLSCLLTHFSLTLCFNFLVFAPGFDVMASVLWLLSTLHQICWTWSGFQKWDFFCQSQCMKGAEYEWL